MQLILVEAPINPRFIREFKIYDFLSEHRALIRKFSSEHGVRYIVLSKLMHFREKQFFDWAHLKDRKAMRRASELIIEKVAKRFETKTKTGISIQ
jgi:hypothetical protein